MPLHWTFDSQQRFVAVVAEGDCVRAEVEAYLQAVEAAGAIGWRKLIDARTGRAAMSRDDMLALGAALRRMHARGAVGALAMVVPADVAERVLRLLGMLATADRPMRIFQEIAKARRWIDGLPAQALTPA